MQRYHESVSLDVSVGDVGVVSGDVGDGGDVGVGRGGVADVSAQVILMKAPRILSRVDVWTRLLMVSSLARLREMKESRELTRALIGWRQRGDVPQKL